MTPLVYQIILLGLGFVAIFAGKSPDVWFATSLVCGAIGSKKGGDA